MKSWEQINEEYEEELRLIREQQQLFKEEGAIQKEIEPIPLNKKEKFKDRHQDSRKRKKGTVSAVISNVIFYGAILLLLAATIMVSSGDSGNGSLLGYRYFHILTSSMDEVYPKGTFVLVSEKAKDDIQVGDDITYYSDPNTTVTHRVIDVIEDFDGQGAKGYETQGTSNLNPDPDISHEENVVGKVVFSIPKLGSAMEFLKEHMVFVFILFIAAILISLVARMLIASRREAKEEEWIEIPK